MEVTIPNAIRSDIASRALAHAFDARAQEFVQVEDGLAREAYNSIFPEADRASVAALPARWFRLDACLNFNVNGSRIQLRARKPGLPVPYESDGSSGYYCHSQIGVIYAGDLADRIMAHVLAKEKHQKDRETALRALNQMLSVAGSVKRLAATWPEGRPFYERYLDVSGRPQLPAVNVATVNAALGLAVQSP